MVDVSGSVYGVDVRGMLPGGFRSYLRAAATGEAGDRSAVEVSFRVVDQLPAVRPIWAAEPGPRRAGRFKLFREPEGFGLEVDSEGHGVFRIAATRIAVEWLSGITGAARCFFSYALPLWLESRGVPVLHASAVSVHDRAVAFVGPSGVGKSTLCAGLLRTGCGFVADDGLALREDKRGDWRCALGPPWLRLWPSALERRLGLVADDLPRVQDSFDKRLLRCAEGDADKAPEDPRLAAVYVLGSPGADAEQLTVNRCTARDSLLRLIEHSLAGGPVAALGWSARRLRLLSRVAARTPVKQLRYPAVEAPWQLVHDAIAADLVAGRQGPTPNR